MGRCSQRYRWSYSTEGYGDRLVCGASEVANGGGAKGLGLCSEKHKQARPWSDYDTTRRV
jgi:hypothetical protein